MGIGIVEGRGGRDLPSEGSGASSLETRNLVRPVRNSDRRADDEKRGIVHRNHGYGGGGVGRGFYGEISRGNGSRVS